MAVNTSSSYFIRKSSVVLQAIMNYFVFESFLLTRILHQTLWVIFVNSKDASKKGE